MRILFATPYYFPELKFGGPPQKMHALSRGLAARGHEIEVVTFHSEQPRACRVELLDGVRVQYLPWFGRGLRQSPLNLRLLATAVRQADIVHGYGLYDLIGPAAAYYARRHRRPYVLEPLGMYVPRARNIFAKRIYHRLFTARMARAAARVVAASPAEGADLKTLAAAAQLVVRRNGIDLAAFEHLPPGDDFRRQWGMAADERIVLYLGRISPIKNLEQLVAAFAQAELNHVRLVLAGPMLEADYAVRLQALAAARTAAGKIIFTGPLFGAAKLAALAAAELFVLPSLAESFGNAAAEAVAARVPVLLTETCGIARMIHGRAGLAVALGEESLAAGLKRMLERPEEAAACMSRREEVRRELSWEEPISQTETMYREILKSGN